MITAKRTKEGIIEISGFDSGVKYSIDFNSSLTNVWVGRLGGVTSIIPIQDEKTELEKSAERLQKLNEGFPKVEDLPFSKYVPTHAELVEMGFVEIDCKYLPNNYHKITSERNIYYLKEENNLQEFGYKKNGDMLKTPFELHFHTKADFQKAIGAYT